jgi:hypothetical protein
VFTDTPFALRIIPGRKVFEAANDSDGFWGEKVFAHVASVQAQRKGYGVGKTFAQVGNLINVGQDGRTHCGHGIIRELVFTMLQYVGQRVNSRNSSEHKRVLHSPRVILRDDDSLGAQDRSTCLPYGP